MKNLRILVKYIEEEIKFIFLVISCYLLFCIFVFIISYRSENMYYWLLQFLMR